MARWVGAGVDHTAGGIQTHDLKIASPALYYTAITAHQAHERPYLAVQSRRDMADYQGIMHNYWINAKGTLTLRIWLLEITLYNAVGQTWHYDVQWFGR